jgi:hypothetical protein
VFFSEDEEGSWHHLNWSKKVCNKVTNVLNSRPAHGAKASDVTESGGCYFSSSLGETVGVHSHTTRVCFWAEIRSSHNYYLRRYQMLLLGLANRFSSRLAKRDCQRSLAILVSLPRLSDDLWHVKVDENETFLCWTVTQFTAALALRITFTVQHNIYKMSLWSKLNVKTNP